MTILIVDELADSWMNDSSNDLDHYYCCDIDRSLCGIDISDDPVRDDLDPEDPCVVCVDLCDYPCSDPACPDRIS